MIVLENSFERLVNETNKPEVRANLSVQISDALRKNKILLNCPPQERSLFSLQKGWPHKKGIAV
jgi:hypothetical protein